MELAIKSDSRIARMIITEASWKIRLLYLARPVLLQQRGTQVAHMVNNNFFMASLHFQTPYLAFPIVTIAQDLVEVIECQLSTRNVRFLNGIPST
jgi:hypothetical protein